MRKVFYTLAKYISPGPILSRISIILHTSSSSISLIQVLSLMGLTLSHSCYRSIPVRRYHRHSANTSFRAEPPNQNAPHSYPISPKQHIINLRYNHNKTVNRALEDTISPLSHQPMRNPTIHPQPDTNPLQHPYSLHHDIIPPHNPMPRPNYLLPLNRYTRSRGIGPQHIVSKVQSAILSLLAKPLYSANGASLW